MSEEVAVNESHGTDEQEDAPKETTDQSAPEIIEESTEKVDAENVAVSANETESQTIDESRENVESANDAAVDDKTESEHEDEDEDEDETGEQGVSEQSREEQAPETDSASADVHESKETEETTEKGSETSQQEKRPQSLDEFEKDMDRKTDVVITKSIGADAEVLEEVRSGYLWEGPCSSSSSSDEQTTDKKKKKVAMVADEEEEDEEDEEEEEEPVEEAEIEIFPREEYMRRYAALVSERILLTKKNVMLQKNIFEYCKKRKLEVYFEEITTPDPKLEAKYTRQLNVFQEFLQLDKDRRISLKDDLEKLQVEQAEAEVTLNRELEELLQTERTVGTGLISAINGKPISDKALEYLLKKQRKAILELHDIRLKYIRLRDLLAGKEADLRKLETFGEGLHLLDYEQLRLENQSYSDKIEERDEELTHLRINATSSIQTLAHIREKANATALNIDDLYEELEFMEIESSRIREFTGDLKKQRDFLRAQLDQLRRQAGLLVHRSLIKDFERRIEESQAMAVEIENLKNNYYDQNKRLTHTQETIKAYKNIKESLGSRNDYDFSSLFAYKYSNRDSQGRKLYMRKTSSVKSEDDGRRVDEIKRGTPIFPREKYSRIIKYVSDIKTMEKETKDDEDNETHSQ